MIQYDNGSQVKILFQMSGSVLPRCLPVGLVSLAAGLALALLRHTGHLEEWLGTEDYLKDDFAIRVVAVIIGYLLVFRCNVALGRWMMGIGEVQVMLAKWTDAFNNLNGFLAGKKGTQEEMQYIYHFRIRVAHYFALMSCLAFAKLRSGHSHADLARVPISAKFPVGGKRLTFNYSTSQEQEDVYSPQGSGGHKMDSLELSTIHLPAQEEIAVLEQCTDKVKTLCLWIAQAIMEKVREGIVDTPPPITTRIFGELTDGMLGFQQALKVAQVPFPFPFAQAVGMSLVMLYMLLPFYIDVFTKQVVLTPIISFVLPMVYCGMNAIAVELEEPFGTDMNDVDIDERHEAFISWMVDVLSIPTEPPVSRDNRMERDVILGYEQRSYEKGYVPWFVVRPNAPDPPQGEEKAKEEPHWSQQISQHGVFQTLSNWMGINGCCSKDAVTKDLTTNEQVVKRIPAVA